MILWSKIENNIFARQDAEKLLAKKNCVVIVIIFQFQFNINSVGHSERLSILPTLMTNI